MNDQSSEDIIGKKNAENSLRLSVKSKKSGAVDVILALFSLVFSIGTFYTLFHGQMTIIGMIGLAREYTHKTLPIPIVSATDMILSSMGNLTEFTDDMIGRSLASLSNSQSPRIAQYADVIAGTVQGISTYGVPENYDNGIISRNDPAFLNYLLYSLRVPLFAAAIFSTTYLLSSTIYAYMNKSIINRAKVYKMSVQFGSLVTSTVHALIVCALGLLWHFPGLLPRDHPSIKNMVGDHMNGYSSAPAVQMGIASGYFIYDLLICIYHYKAFGNSFLIHAMVCLSIYMISDQTATIQYYTTFFLLFELSTLFLNVATYAKEIANVDGIAVRLSHIVGGAFFLIIRIFVGYQFQKPLQAILSMSNNEVFISIDKVATFYSSPVVSSAMLLTDPVIIQFHERINRYMSNFFMWANFIIWTLNCFWGVFIMMRMARAVEFIINSALGNKNTKKNQGELLNHKKKL